MDRLEGIDAGEAAEIVGRRPEAVQRKIGAEGRARPHPQGEEFAVLVERQLDVADVVARVVVGDEAFAPVAPPFHRTADTLGRPGGQRDLRIERALHAEGAAHVPGDQPHLVLGDLEQVLGQRRAPGIGALHAGVDGVVAFAVIVIGERAARLHRIGVDAIDHEALPEDMRRGLDGRVRAVFVAELAKEAFVVRALVPDRGRARRRRLGRLDIGGKRLVINLDGLRRILGDVHRLRQDHRDDLTHMAGPVLGDRRPRGPEHGRAVTPLQGRRAGDETEAVRLVIGAGEDGNDARHRQCRARIDLLDRRVRVRRPEHHGIGLVDHVVVVDIQAVTAQKARILGAGNRLTDRIFQHVHSPSEFAHDRSRANGITGPGRGFFKTAPDGGVFSMRWMMTAERASLLLLSWYQA